MKSMDSRTNQSNLGEKDGEVRKFKVATKVGSYTQPFTKNPNDIYVTRLYILVALTKKERLSAYWARKKLLVCLLGTKKTTH